MRKPRDYDAELKALDDKARQLKRRKVEQLGELVVATGADALDIEELAGVLLVAAANSDSAKKEAWRQRGRGFFSGEGSAGRATATKPSRVATAGGGTQPANAGTRPS